MNVNEPNSFSADPPKGDTQGCQTKNEEAIPKSSPFDFVIKQFQGKRSTSGKSKEQPSAIKKFFSGFDFGKSEGKDGGETEETEKNNSSAEDQSEKQDLSLDGNVGTVEKSTCMCVHFNFIENHVLSVLAQMLYLLPIIYSLARICF